MLSQKEMNDRFETQEMRLASPGPNDGLRIEEILRRAREIHRARGGVFAYDFEDWLQAWGELPELGGRRELDLIEANGDGSLEAHG
jgi:hypothetical protein